MSTTSTQIAPLESLPPSLRLQFFSALDDDVESLLEDIRLFGDIEYGNEETWRFAYHTINGAHPNHRECIAMMHFYGDAEICAKLNMSLTTVLNIQQHPPMIQFKNFIDLHRRLSSIKVKGEFQDGLAKGVRLMRDRIASGAVDDRALGTWMKLFLEHDPEHQFPKIEGTKKMDAVDDDKITQIAIRAAELIREKKMAQTIQVEAQETSDASGNHARQD